MGNGGFHQHLVGNNQMSSVIFVSTHNVVDVDDTDEFRDWE